jgi:hypothetical protein
MMKRMKGEEVIEIINELVDEISKLSWMFGINYTDLLNLLMRYDSEGLDEDEVLAELKELNPDLFEE